MTRREIAWAGPAHCCGTHGMPFGHGDVAAGKLDCGLYSSVLTWQGRFDGVTYSWESRVYSAWQRRDAGCALETRGCTQSVLWRRRRVDARGERKGSVSCVVCEVDSAPLYEAKERARTERRDRTVRETHRPDPGRRTVHGRLGGLGAV